jgi:hypothetical protein
MHWCSQSTSTYNASSWRFGEWHSVPALPPSSISSRKEMNNPLDPTVRTEHLISLLGLTSCLLLGAAFIPCHILLLNFCPARRGPWGVLSPPASLPNSCGISCTAAGCGKPAWMAMPPWPYIRSWYVTPCTWPCTFGLWPTS